MPRRIAMPDPASLKPIYDTPATAAAHADQSKSPPATDSARPAKGFDRATGPDKTDVAGTLKEGVRYTSLFGFRSLFGVCHIEKRQGVYHFHVPIRFVGATPFASCSPEVVRAESGFDKAPAVYFKKGATSIDQIPALKARVLEITKVIEATLRTDKCQIHIEPIFPDETKLIGKSTAMSEAELRDVAKDLPGPSAAVKLGMVRFRMANGDLIDGINRHNNPRQPILIYVLPSPNPNVITPTAWDPYANPLLLAHEFAHCLGVATEGYELKDYPADGLMKDECYMNALAAQKLAPRLLPTDFNELMLSHIDRLQPAIDKAKAEREFKKTSAMEYTQSSGWWDLKPGDRHRIATEDVARLVAAR
jgi:hypothetical protein